MVKAADSVSDDKAGREETAPIVEEELSIGKREVASGGARVTSSVEERPVEKTVSLREEEVEADRRSADRELSPEEAEAAFEGKTVEMMGTSEEAEVSKTARVVGEVSLNKQTNEREQTVRDTVRRTDVEVEEVEPSSR
jgi:stress response protein YsnF